MSSEPDDGGRFSHQKPPTPEEMLRKCWADLVSLSHEPLRLPEIYARAEKLVQYCCAMIGEERIGWLKAQIAAGERLAVAALATDPDSLHHQRLHAALTGARAGLLYPLGWSPRDLNLMVF